MHPPAMLPKSNSSARAIRKAALACLLRLRRFFAHELALSSSDCPSPDSYASINPPPDIRWLNCCNKKQAGCTLHPACVISRYIRALPARKDPSDLQI